MKTQMRNSHPSSMEIYMPAPQAVPLHDHQVMFEQLSRQEEVHTDRRDQWGNWEAPFADTFYDGRLFSPWLDEQLKGRSTIWPNNSPFALFLSHDVDHVTRFSTAADLWKLGVRTLGRVVEPKQFAKKLAGFIWSKIRCSHRSPVNDIEQWIRLENKYGFKSTFYFFPEHLEKPHFWDCCYSYSNKCQFFDRLRSVREVMSNIRERGWEIGLHPGINAYSDPDALQDQKSQVERASGGPVISVRQHYLRYDMRITPDVHEQCGFLTDSTHGFNRFIGFRAGTSFPYPVWSHVQNRPTSVMELPLNIMDVSLLSTGGLECDTAAAVKRSLEMMDRVQAVGGMLTLNWHPECREDPRIKEIYAQILQEAHLRGAWGASASMIHRHLTHTGKPATMEGLIP